MLGWWSPTTIDRSAVLWVPSYLEDAYVFSDATNKKVVRHFRTKFEIIHILFPRSISVQFLRLSLIYLQERKEVSGARGGAVGWGTELQAGRSRVRFPMMSLTESFRPHCIPGVDSIFNRKEYQEYSWRIKAAGSWGWQPYHFHVPIVLKSGSLKLLELSGLVQSRTGFVLPFNLSTNLYPGCS